MVGQGSGMQVYDQRRHDLDLAWQRVRGINLAGTRRSARTTRQLKFGDTDLVVTTVTASGDGCD